MRTEIEVKAELFDLNNTIQILNQRGQILIQELNQIISLKNKPEENKQ